MFITDQHRQQIRQYFTEMNRCVEILEKVADTSREDFCADGILQAAGERAFHIALECVTDVGNLIIDALIMRDPSSYEDIVQVLAEENMFPKEFAQSFMEAVKFRRVLAHDYLERDIDRLFFMIQTHKLEFAAFRNYVADYVQLGS
ncbi:type VII toxin-antitoxin system HepT family RNase toxin [Effusibacillus consociatus]|uniref:DUF86 domain-containing protein n=1 Tax=Effusibacillus consociatus TaxID=1117041 RepID=A0ABV9PVJ8_9BACL